MADHVDAPAIAAPPPIRAFKFVWGVLATALSVVWTFIVATLVALLVALGAHRPVDFLSRWWGWLIIKLCGITVDIEGLDNLAGLKSYVLVSNHQSFFDIFATLAYMPGATRFVAKRELLKIPLIGYSIKGNGHIIIDRQSGGRAIRNAVEEARKGHPLCVFAEGHRHNDGRVHEFEEGAAWLAIVTKLPCVPMSISGSGTFFPREAKVVVPGQRMTIRLLPPIPTEGLRSGDRAALTKRLEDEVRSVFVPCSRSEEGP
jgi:1-acyl-sn-glycerol-3-phosphate acyltransferase